MSDGEDSFGDYEAKLTNMFRKALFVQPRAVDLDTVPADGHEYIFKSRLESSMLKFPVFDLPSSSKEKPKNTIRKELNEINMYWIRTRLCFLVEQLKASRSVLVEKYPKSDELSATLENEEKCCTFCLGSKVSTSIYINEDKKVSAEPHLPLLCHIIHLSRVDVLKLLAYFHKWFKSLGMTESICQWIFALLICLNKPITDDEEEFLENIYGDCLEHLSENQVDEFIRLYFIVSILKHHYCIKGYTSHDYMWLNGRVKEMEESDDDTESIYEEKGIKRITLYRRTSDE